MITDTQMLFENADLSNITDTSNQSFSLTHDNITVEMIADLSIIFDVLQKESEICFEDEDRMKLVYKTCKRYTERIREAYLLYREKAVKGGVSQEANDNCSTFEVISALWKMIEVMLYPGSEVTMQLVLHYESTAGDRLLHTDDAGNVIGVLEDSGEYWRKLTRLIFCGRFTDVIEIIEKNKSLPRDIRDSLNYVLSSFPLLTSNRASVDAKNLGLPNFEQTLAGKFREWHLIIKKFLPVVKEFTHIEKLFRVLLVEEEIMQAECDNWLEYMTAMVMLKKPLTLKENLKFLSKKCAREFHSSIRNVGSYDWLMLHVCVGDFDQVITASAKLFPPWVAAHMTDLLFHAQIVNDLPLTNRSDHIVNMLEGFSDNIDLCLTAPQYLMHLDEEDEEEGATIAVETMKKLLLSQSMKEIKEEDKVLALISVCNEFSPYLDDVRASMCRERASHCISQMKEDADMIKKAVFWLLQSGNISDLLTFMEQISLEWLNGSLEVSALDAVSESLPVNDEHSELPFRAHQLNEFLKRCANMHDMMERVKKSEDDSVNQALALMLKELSDCFRAEVVLSSLVRPLVNKFLPALEKCLESPMSSHLMDSNDVLIILQAIVGHVCDPLEKHPDTGPCVKVLLGLYANTLDVSEGGGGNVSVYSGFNQCHSSTESELMTGLQV